MPCVIKQHTNPGAYLCCKWVPYFCKNHVDGHSKTNIFSSKYLECKTKSVCFDEKRTNFGVKHTNSWIFQHPTVGSQKFNTPSCRVVGIPKYAPAQTKYMQLAIRLLVQVPAAAKYFFNSMFNLGIANGANVGLKTPNLQSSWKYARASCLTTWIDLNSTELLFF